MLSNVKFNQIIINKYIHSIRIPRIMLESQTVEVDNYYIMTRTKMLLDFTNNYCPSDS